MNTRNLSLLAATLGLLGGCVTTQATTSPNANLGQYRTFSFFQPTSANPKQLAFEQSPAGQVVRDRVTSDLQSKGLTQSADNPDLLIAYHSKLEEKTDVTDWGYGGYYWGGPGGVTVDQYTQGTLLIDFIDPKTKQVVWRGTASAIVNHPDNPDTGKLASAVDKLMKKYPAELASTSRPAM
jgi:hypothetical protein